MGDAFRKAFAVLLIAMGIFWAMIGLTLGIILGGLQ